MYRKGELIVTYHVRAPGTCGEFIQGSMQGQSFLVTCPINRYSYAMSDVSYPLKRSMCALQPKAYLAYERTLEYLEIQPEQFSPIYVRSDIIQGKGMASSSADISVTAMATALAYGRRLSMKELEKICLSIEPTDASFYPSIIQFDYQSGRISKSLGVCPPMKIVIFDEGGTIDTVDFNKRTDLSALIREKETFIEEAINYFIQGLELHDISLIGQAATISAFANQRILYKPHLYIFHDIGIRYKSVGTIIAHSGTIMGLLFPNDYSGIADCIYEIKQNLPTLTYIDTVETTCEGITFVKR